MNLNCNIPLPVNLNCWKHHAGFIKEQIKFVLHKKLSAGDLRKILLVIGESQTDIYLGKFTPVEIANEIMRKLSGKGKFKFPDYENWLNEDEKDYKLLTISDNSIWTLRMGNAKERYIHIHPGRYSPLTIRVKSSTLKTFVVSEIFLSDLRTKEDELSFINKVRNKYLQLPPLKSISSASGLRRLKNVFNSISV